MHEPVRAHRARRLGTPRFALAVLDGGRAGARGLAHRDLHRDAAAEMLLESRLQLVLVGAIGQIGLLLRHCELEEAALAATKLGVARQLARRAGERELARQLGPALVGGRRTRLRLFENYAVTACALGPEREHAQQGHDEARVLVGRERQVFPALQRDLVIELHRLGVDALGKIDDRRALGQVLAERIGHRLRHRDAQQQAGEGGEGAIEGQAARLHLVGHGDRGSRVVRRNRRQQPQQMSLVDRAEHLAHARCRHPAAAVSDRLVEQGERVPHAAGCSAGNQRERLAIKFDILAFQDPAQMRGDGGGRHLLQVELQAAAEHRHRDLLRIGRGKDEFQVLGRLFQGLQHGVERRRRQHVHFVDHVHLVAPAARNVLRGLEQLAHFVDPRVGGRVHLEQIDEAPGVDFQARRALAAGLRRDAGFAIEAFRQDAGESRLADPPRTGEQVRVMQPLLLERVPQCPDDVLLPHQAAEVPRPPLAGKYLIAHR